ncbi:MAG: prenyltransferase/squalene oxidase repeat-containing protein, partial [Mycobacteriales bacterium]
TAADPATTYTDYGRSLDAAIALLAAGGHDDLLGRTLTSVATADAVTSYTGAGVGGETYAGATAKLAFVIAATGGDANNVGGVKLLDQLRSLVGSDGRVADKSAYGNFAGLFAQAFAVLAFDTAGVAQPSGLVQGLTSAQCANGSFPLYFTKSGETCTGSVDATGLVLQALAAVDLGTSSQATAARDWLLGQQKADGSFPGEAPVNSTGYAAAGLLAVGADISKAQSYLVSQQQSDGGLARGAGAPGSDLFATAQALPALAGRTFQSQMRTITRVAIPCATAVTTLAQTVSTATQQVLVTLKATSGTTVDLYAYSRPSTDFSVVRSAVVDKSGTVQVAVKPSSNTRLYAQQQGCTAGSSVALNVRTALALAVVRNGVRTYTFSGTAIPARKGGLIVSLYRLTPDGRSVLTAQTRASETTGTWTIRRVFTGTGRFPFVLRTGQDLINAPGSSNTRSVLIY